MVRCTIGKTFTLLLFSMAFVVATVLLSEYRSALSGGAQLRNHHRGGPKYMHYSKHHAKTLLKNSQALDESVVNQVQAFLVFVGYPRSGHSIVGSCLDAHPDAIVAHEFNLFSRMVNDERESPPRNRTELYRSLYLNSYRESLVGWRSQQQSLHKKGYTLHINTSNSWQGRFKQLKVIGDKSGGLTTHAYYSSPDKFISAYHLLSDVVKVPIKFLHVVRNPYDIISTKLRYRMSERRGRKGNFTMERPVTDIRRIMQATRSLKSEARGVRELVERLQPDILEVHNVDFVLRTKETLLRICNFLGLECNDDYLELCDRAVYNKPSRSRTAVVWTKGCRDSVDDLIQTYPFFSRYSFSSN